MISYEGRGSPSEVAQQDSGPVPWSLSLLGTQGEASAGGPSWYSPEEAVPKAKLGEADHKVLDEEMRSGPETQPNSPRAGWEREATQTSFPTRERARRLTVAAQWVPRGWLTPGADLSTPQGPSPSPSLTRDQDQTIETANQSCENSYPLGKDKGMQSINQRERDIHAD